MSREGTAVWVVASGATAGRWAASLGRAGFEAVALPWSEVALPEDPTPIFAGLAAAPDLVLLTSANAVGALGAGAAGGRPAACVGRATAEAARRAGFDVRLVGEGGAEDLARRILRELPGAARILFLRGQEARDEGVEVLRRAGRRVETVTAYEMRPRPAFVADVRAAPAPRAVVVGSPRAAEALADALRGPTPEGRSLLDAPVLAVGETTATHLRGLGFPRVLAAPRADGEALGERLREALGEGR